jgi:hypothetical protein
MKNASTRTIMLIAALSSTVPIVGCANSGTRAWVSMSDSELARNRAATDAQNLQNLQAQREQTARLGLGAVWERAAMVAQPDGTRRPATAQEMAPHIGNLMQAATNAYSDPVKAAEALRMVAGLSGDRNFQTNTALGAGGSFAQTPIGQTQGEGAAFRTSTAVARINAGSAANVAKINSDALAARQDDARAWGRSHHAPTLVGSGQADIPAANNLPLGISRGLVAGE